MTLQQLKYIVMIAEKKSISQAALALFISQPSLTNAVKELENEMKIMIFRRTNKGVTVTEEGELFLIYARQILEQTYLLEEKFLHLHEHAPKFSVSCQHYSFAVSAFVDVIKQFDADRYDFTLRETQTHELIEDIISLKSEIGILYTSDDNEKVILNLIRKNNLKLEYLFTAKPHVFISSKHPLANKMILTLDELMDYPYLSFEQGEHNSFYYAEELLSSMERKKHIKVRDRATLFNLVIGLNGYTISSGMISEELNGEHIISRELVSKDTMHIGVVTQKDIPLSRYGHAYIHYLKKYIEAQSR